MKRKYSIQNSWLYRFRYPIAGIILALIATFMVAYRFWDVPAGLSQAEVESAASTSALYYGDPILHPASDADSLVNLPWSVLQWLSINIFGLSVMSLRLPAVILTLISVILLILLVRRLIRPSLAMMAGLLLVSSSFMISIARAGTPIAMTTFLLILLLLCAYHVLSDQSATRRRLAVVGLMVTAGLMCYMVGGVYILLTILLVAVLHPQTRLVIRRGAKLIPVAMAGLVITTLPLIIAVIHGILTGNNNSVMELFAIGVPSVDNLVACLLAYAGLQPSVVGGLVAPMLTMVGAALVGVGLIYVAATARTSIRFYLIIGMIVLSLILGSCDPAFVFLLFIPTIILEAMALSYITSKWYNLFPNNPYARVFAIVPIAILIGSLCSVDASRYFNAVSYNSKVVYGYDQTLPILIDFIKDNQDVQLGIVASDDTADSYLLYSLLSLQYDNVEISSKLPNRSMGVANGASSSGKVVILGNEGPEISDNVVLSDIRTGWTKDDSVVLRAYTVRTNDADDV